MKNLLLMNCIIAVFATCMLSCSSDEPALSESVSQQTTDPNFISLDEAVANADEAFKSMLGKSKKHTRSNIEAEMFMPQKTRGGQEEMYGFYVLNYGEGEGFALLSADRRRTPVYALSEEGSMHLSDTTGNRGLSWYVNEHINSIPAGRTGYIPIDTLIAQPFFPSITKTVYSERLIKGIMEKFHQDYPYNKYCPTITENGNSKNAKVGCLALALGTVMGYYEWPESAFN